MMDANVIALMVTLFLGVLFWLVVGVIGLRVIRVALKMLSSAEKTYK